MEEERSFSSSSFSVFRAKQKSVTLFWGEKGCRRQLDHGKWTEEGHTSYLEGDEQLGEVVVELGPLLQVPLQLHEGVIGRGEALEGVLPAAALTTPLL